MTVNFCFQLGGHKNTKHAKFVTCVPQWMQYDGQVANDLAVAEIGA